MSVESTDQDIQVSVGKHFVIKETLAAAFSKEWWAASCCAVGEILFQSAAVNDAVANTKVPPQIGDKMEDGTILAGYYKGRPLYTTPNDAPGGYTFNEAASYAKTPEAHGHHDFHVPNIGELDELYRNCFKGRLRGTFNETGAFDPNGWCSPGWYWSSARGGDIFDNSRGYALGFRDGSLDDYGRYLGYSLRCVRG